MVIRSPARASRSRESVPPYCFSPFTTRMVVSVALISLLPLGWGRMSGPVVVLGVHVVPLNVPYSAVAVFLYSAAPSPVTLVKKF